MVFVKGPKEKRSRAVGENLLLKAQRSASQKSALIRKPYRPGQHGKRRRMLSEYGTQLLEKQKVRLLYGLTEKQVGKYAARAKRSKTLAAPDALIQELELRMDNVVFRSGFAPSRSVARHMVSHGHIWVDGRRVDIPSRALSTGSVISIRPESKGKKLFSEIQAYLKRYTTPTWLNTDPEQLKATIVRLPTFDDAQVNADFAEVMEYYSR
ncbi:MAG: 30S ribosomal protein S4 [Parcubacteria group bacterium GW2011_GWB1_46_8]|nr:MAG: 30S ribosomal protein S4 [Parcubacteria group bacterium GW2011_GWF1_45_5]KKU44183.1 MAG: 30S ribosomal protein S4 [Parcubacteria group bacterium GW2011_GWA2_46_7]KKU46608.1 MAG: 30S ribosomal protein S4 [Parcubacteria group bacterium GW2011_GWB1_46_8]KKU47349.1 MAG: 30S ribosomal protein S4 [Parcubacteria group bacterium GW2011_GWF2_46_8]